jgi:hypothetical protein
LLKISKILMGFKLNMINSNYKIRVKINRPNLYQLLLKKKINVTYEKASICMCKICL